MQSLHVIQTCSASHTRTLRLLCTTILPIVQLLLPLRVLDVSSILRTDMRIEPVSSTFFMAIELLTGKAKASNLGFTQSSSTDSAILVGGQLLHHQVVRGAREDPFSLALTESSLVPDGVS